MDDRVREVESLPKEADISTQENDDLAKTLRLLQMVTTSHDGQWIAPCDANGFVLHLVQDDKFS